MIKTLVKTTTKKLSLKRSRKKDQSLNSNKVSKISSRHSQSALPTIQYDITDKSNPPANFQISAQLIYMILSDPMIFLRACIILVLMSGVVILVMRYLSEMVKVLMDTLKWGSVSGSGLNVMNLMNVLSFIKKIAG